LLTHKVSPPLVPICSARCSQFFLEEGCRFGENGTLLNEDQKQKHFNVFPIKRFAVVAKIPGHNKSLSGLNQNNQRAKLRTTASGCFDEHSEALYEHF